jgi:flagellar biosynthetic protein FliR
MNPVPFDLTTWLMIFLRVTALLAIFPLFSMQNIPVQVRLALAASVSFLIAPGLPPLAAAPATVPGLVLLMVGEVAVGLLLGFVSRILFYMLEFAGNLIASEMGMNWGATFNPFSSTRSEAPGLILFYLGAMIFLTLDLHQWILRALQRSYQMLPIGGAHLGPALFTEIVARTSQLFLAGLLMAAPVIAVSFLINLVFSVIGRAVPQMNVFVESFSFRTLAGLMVFGLTLNLMAQHVVNYLRRLPEDFIRIAQLLAQ